MTLILVGSEGAGGDEEGWGADGCGTAVSVGSMVGRIGGRKKGRDC